MEKKQILELVKNSFRVVRVWKVRICDKGDDYNKGWNKGWNDCLLQQKINEKKLIKDLELQNYEK